MFINLPLDPVDFARDDIDEVNVARHEKHQHLVPHKVGLSEILAPH
jgi:hypothetical protein